MSRKKLPASKRSIYDGKKSFRKCRTYGRIVCLRFKVVGLTAETVFIKKMIFNNFKNQGEKIAYNPKNHRISK